MAVSSDTAITLTYKETIMIDLTNDDHRTALRVTTSTLLAQSGKLATTLPAVRRVIRVNNTGFTLPTHSTAVLPLYSDDIYIGRIVENGITTTNDMIVYRIDVIGGVEHYLYIDTRDLSPWLADHVVNHYNYVSSCRNYHALWFRSAVEEYKAKNIAWRNDTKRTQQDLESLYRSHIHLGRDMRIPRFAIELERLQDFWATSGFYTGNTNVHS